MNIAARTMVGLVFVLLVLAPSTLPAATLTIADANGSPGETIAIPVMGDDITGVAAMQVFIQYDTAVLEFQAMSTDYMSTWLTNVTDGKIILNWEGFSSLLTLPAGEVLFSMSFLVLPAAASENSTEIGFIDMPESNEYVELVNYEAQTIPVDLLNGTVSFSPTGVDDDPASLPAAFELKQNYPNPFNPVTTVAYTVNRSGEYRLDVFNLSGQSVRHIDLGRKMPGAYTLPFTAENLPSGIYTYRLTGENQSSSRQMILLK